MVGTATVSSTKRQSYSHWDVKQFSSKSICIVLVTVIIGESRDAWFPLDPIFWIFFFMQFSGKNDQNNSLAPLLCVGVPRLANPGFATSNFFCRIIGQTKKTYLILSNCSFLLPTGLPDFIEFLDTSSKRKILDQGLTKAMRTQLNCGLFWIQLWPTFLVSIVSVSGCTERNSCFYFEVRCEMVHRSDSNQVTD